jgi:glycosyltransferase involved in cell wall biosynthesis
MICLLSMSHGEGFGAETNLVDLLEAWPSGLGKACVVAPDSSRALREAARLGHRTVPLPTDRDKIFLNLKAVHQIRSQLRDVKLLHAWNSRAFDAAVWLSRALKVPSCGTFLDHPHAEFNGRIRHFLMKFSAERMNAAVVVSHAMEDEFKSAGYRTRLCAIHSGLVDKRFQRQPAAKVRIGFLGMYAPWKGFDIVEGWIRALGGIRASWHLFGRTIPEWESSSQRLRADFPETVFLEGFCDPTEIFQRIDLLVHASTGFDPLPNVLVESLRAGIPALASNRGGGPEIVLDGKTGYVVDVMDHESPVEKIRFLVENPNALSEMGAEARSWFEAEYRVDRMAAAYESLWRELLSA